MQREPQARKRILIINGTTIDATGHNTNESGNDRMVTSPTHGPQVRGQGETGRAGANRRVTMAVTMGRLGVTPMTPAQMMKLAKD